MLQSYLFYKTFNSGKYADGQTSTQTNKPNQGKVSLGSDEFCLVFVCSFFFLGILCCIFVSCDFVTSCFWSALIRSPCQLLNICIESCKRIEEAVIFALPRAFVFIVDHTFRHVLQPLLRLECRVCKD